MDAGDIWASVEFPMRDASKSSLYRNEVTEAAVVALRADARAHRPGRVAAAARRARPAARGRLRPADAPAGSRHRLACRRYGHRVAQDPRGRRLSGRARRGARRRACTCSTRTRKGGSARSFRRPNPGDVIAQPRRRHPARDRSTAPSGSRICGAPATTRTSSFPRQWSWASASPTCPRRRWPPTRSSTTRRGGRFATRKRAPSATCTFRSATARWARRSATSLRRRRPHGQGAPDARARADGRTGLLVERNPSQPDRGRGASGGGVVAQHQRHERPGARDHRRRRPDHDRRDAGQRRRRRRLPGARRGPRLGPRRHRRQSALQGHGQPLRVGILDLPAPAPRRRRRGATR